MCVLYSQTKGQAAVRKAAKVMKDNVGNLPLFSAIKDNDFAPVVRNTPEGRELAMLRWGMPSPPKLLEGKRVDPGVHNVRNTGSPYWRPWLGVEHRCVVPFTSFSEFDQVSKCDVWYAVSEDRPLCFFAGIWLANWTGVRKRKEGQITSDVFAFLTTDQNSDVKNANAMPVILQTEAEIDTWLTAPTSEALALQHPLTDDTLRTLARGVKQDGEGIEAKTFVSIHLPTIHSQGSLF